ncbi:fibronectin type III domain-containing protein [Aeromicrobium sp. CTD01-1L150]|uniref:fibronectin type III domain-containing protein n=1 Tax=Aeromicrobium sp. CTD01-1L150 TaxID=3341830 RepID=UPI0035BF5A6F
MIRRVLSATVCASVAALVLVGPTAADTSASTEPDRIVLNPTASPDTSQSVTWRTKPDAGTGLVEVREAGADGVRRVAADQTARARLRGLDPAVHHTATLQNLTPGTSYEYRVGNDRHGWSTWSGFRTADHRAEPWEFLYFGDAQNGLDTVWPQVAGAAFEEHPDARASLYAGDLVNQADDDAEWGHWFDAVGERAREQQVIATPGNHEHIGDLRLQQYRAHFAFPDNGPVLRDEDVWYTDHQGVRFVSLNGNAPLGGPDQAGWLDRILRDNPNRWTVVTFHYPLFSFRPGRDNIATRTLWLPILEKHGVDLVLQGHDHGYARGHVAENEQDDGVAGPAYVVSVAGSKYYEADGEDRNNWTRNGARRVTALEQVSTYQSIRVEQDRLVYRSVAAAVGAEPTDGVQPGDVVDAFTVTKTDEGRPLVTDDPIG